MLTKPVTTEKLDLCAASMGFQGWRQRRMSAPYLSTSHRRKKKKSTRVSVFKWEIVVCEAWSINYTTQAYQINCTVLTKLTTNHHCLSLVVVGELGWWTW
jgi:hypothetical protein